MIGSDEALDRWYEQWLRQIAAEASKQRAQAANIPAPMSAVRKFGG